MKPGAILIITMATLFISGTVFCQTVDLELIMPATLFGPGSIFSLDLTLANNGSELTGVQMFVALSIGSDFWFYPHWYHYPPDIDFEVITIAAGADETKSIIPEFPWPSGAGEFNGAMFFAAIVNNGALASNLADYTFGWTNTIQPTPTPDNATSTPTEIPENTHTPQPTSTPTPSGPTPTPSPVPTEFVYIAPGSFTMGSPENEPCRSTDEVQHEVTLTRGFYIQQTEVNRQMWADLKAGQPDLPDDPSFETYSPTLNHPVQYVTWYESVLFCNLLSVQEGYTRCFYKDAAFTTPVDSSNYTSGDFFCNFDANGYRLPTEAEWEYVCRAGTTTPFSCEEDNYTEENCSSCTEGTHPSLEEYCVYCANDPETTETVGSRLPNPWGLYDIHGNVWEWCWDWYGDYPTGSITDPTGPSTGDDHMRRGGAWRLVADNCRSASRFIITPEYRLTFQGIRILRTED